MRSILLALSAAVVSVSGAGDTAAALAEDPPVYELRIYTCEPGRLDALHKRFREHTVKLFEKHGMTNVAYWTPTDEPRSKDTLIYVLGHKSREAAKASWAAFRADPEWARVREASEQDGKILAKAPEAWYMAATDYSPNESPAAKDKVYELRVYTAPDGKLEALHERFRKHTDKLFAEHGMKSWGYWAPEDEPASKNLLIYVLEHDSRDAAKKSWPAFLDDPRWKEAHAESEEDGKLVSKIEATYMQVTDYTPAE
jgi:hypothetical protein